MECSDEGCGRPVKALGLCQNHYMRWRRKGEGAPARTKARPPCSIEGCEEPNFGHGYCQKHYTRWRNNGDPNKVLRHTGNPEANFWAKVNVGAGSDCWQWTGAKDPQGYGSFMVGRVSVGAHRWAYRELVGPIPDGAQLDHVCHSRDLSCPGGPCCPHRACVNPAHLEPVTGRQNWSRGRAPTASNSLKTQCKNGHEFTPENTYNRPAGGRQCRACGRAQVARYLERKRRKRGYERAREHDPPDHRGHQDRRAAGAGTGAGPVRVDRRGPGR